jgi:hypothetical protein
MENNYLKYRGKCKEMSEALVFADPTLTLVRGHYLCPYWGKQDHWWTVKPDGTIVDPTVLQFPSKGAGEYVPFNGMVECTQCGKELPEAQAQFARNYALCSYKCYGKLVGVF